MNASQHKVRFGFNYRKSGGVAVNASARWHDGYEVRSGVHNGTVDPYFIIDVGAGYDLSEYVPGTAKLDVMAQNVLDNRHREYVSVPEVGRLITTRLTYTF
jgi:iron complex outermembrane receptor protein